MEDAEYTGMTSLAKVISSGHASQRQTFPGPGRNFRGIFVRLTLSFQRVREPGGLIGEADGRIFFLLMAKCNVISEYLGIETGSFRRFQSFASIKKTNEIMKSLYSELKRMCAIAKV
jgi:uncharacterized protein with ATP-grasp and redox domains